MRGASGYAPDAGRPALGWFHPCASSRAAGGLQPHRQGLERLVVELRLASAQPLEKDCGAEQWFAPSGARLYERVLACRCLGSRLDGPADGGEAVCRCGLGGDAGAAGYGGCNDTVPALCFGGVQRGVDTS